MTIIGEGEGSPPPTDVRINGKPESPAMATKSTGRVDVSARIFPTQAGARVRLVIWLSADNFKTKEIIKGDFQRAPANGVVQEFVIRGLRQNTRYRMRLWNDNGSFYSTPNTADFWTNRTPNTPGLVQPTENAQFLVSSPVLFDWSTSDPDPADPQAVFQLQWREAAGATNPAGAWVTTTGTTATSYQAPGGTFKANRFYDWRVRSRDAGGLWSAWSILQSIYIIGTHTPPQLLSPINGTAVDVSLAAVFTWRFRDPDQGDAQVRADLRYRVVGTDDWFVITGDTENPGAEWSYQVPPNTFAAGQHYEWQVRTYDSGSGGSTPSDWSESAHFYSIVPPGSGLPTDVAPINETVQGALGCGTHRAFLYAQGGLRMLGEIKPLRTVTWGRKRDDISNAVITTNGFDDDCGTLLAEMRSWIHELVVFRDGPQGPERVFEGPITRITYTVDGVEVEAKDCMAYLYRRIMRQGYNDSYRVVRGVQLGLTTVVNRAAQIVANALAPHDPNLLQYLTVFRNTGDAEQSRVIPDYSKTAWEEIDDLAATAGLDYVTVGRRIMLWDTHNPIGKLPEMRDGDFSSPPVVTEYGMNLANYFAVTDGNGIWGAAIPLGRTDPATGGDAFEFYGPIEQLASAYGEAESGDTGTELTPAGRERRRLNLAEQARRNISNRWPTPLVVRVPDNSTLNPEVNLGIQQLVPGVWIPLRATGTVRTVSQWQKLDSITVTESEGTESVQVVMSPAPNGGNDDPDAGAGEAV